MVLIVLWHRVSINIELWSQSSNCTMILAKPNLHINIFINSPLFIMVTIRHIFGQNGQNNDIPGCLMSTLRTAQSVSPSTTLAMGVFIKVGIVMVIGIPLKG